MKITWISTENYLYGRTHEDSLENKHIAAFDLDDTLIKVKSGNKFQKDTDDWEFYSDDVVDKLKEYSKKYMLCIISNQMGVGSGKITIAHLKEKLEKVVNKINLNFVIFCALKNDLYRKPRDAFWHKFIKGSKESFYCGDAAGLPERTIKDIIIKKDFADTDLKLAMNIGVKFIHRDEFIYGVNYPENKYTIKYPVKFTNEKIAQYVFESKPPELIINVGFPASGKSTYTINNITAKYNYVYVNQDTLKTLPKCLKLVADSLLAKKSVIVDNTNLTKEIRGRYIEIAKKLNIPVKCLLFDTPLDVCIHNSYFRNYITNGNVPVIQNIVYNKMKQQYQKPTVEEGFTKIETIQFTHTTQNLNIYKKYFQ